ncbi:hypothetical protein ACQ4PT_033570 [Festuca glaucescens]
MVAVEVLRPYGVITRYSRMRTEDLPPCKDGGKSVRKRLEVGDGTEIPTVNAGALVIHEKRDTAMKEIDPKVGDIMEEDSTKDVNENKIVSHYIGPNFIDIAVGEVGAMQWRFTGFYGEPSWENRDNSWDFIRQLNIEFDLPWLIMGDFNEVLYAHEKEGGNTRPLGMMQKFRECLSDCGLEDLGYIGDIFTWRRGEIRERLDSAVGNERWLTMFPYAAVINEEHARLDHRPIVVDTEYHAGMCQPRRTDRCSIALL